MNKKVFFLLIALMSLSLMGIIFVQGYWIKKTIDSEEAQFSSNARQSLIKVADKAQNKELEKYYVQYASAADTIEKPTSRDLSQLFHIRQNDLTNETFFYTNSILQEDFKVQSNIPGSEKDSINFKKLVNHRITRVVRGNEVNKDLDLSNEKKFERISRMEDTERRLLLDVIKEKTAKEPLYKRIDKDELGKLIDEQLEMRNIKSDYDFGIFSNELATKVSTANFNIGSAASYGVSIFPSDETNYKLYLHFNDKKKEIFSSIQWMVIMSIIFTLIILFAYAGAIFQLLKQRRISQIKTDFINNMTHEFKTPIATINLALDSVDNPKISSNPDKLKTYMKMIRDENHRMHAQVENVLRISKLERNELDINKERLVLHELIEKAISSVNLIVENRDGYIHTHFDAMKSTVLAGDSHFVSVIVNILDNAIKYSNNQPPKIDVFTENVSHYIVMKIQDQGSGMNKSVQKKIFDKFYREHTGDIHNVKGHGLGLAYVKKIVEDHQGEISVESEKGKGSTFIIKLPLIS